MQNVQFQKDLNNARAIKSKVEMISSINNNNISTNNNNNNVNMTSKQDRHSPIGKSGRQSPKAEEAPRTRGEKEKNTRISEQEREQKTRNGDQEKEKSTRSSVQEKEKKTRNSDQEKEKTTRSSVQEKKTRSNELKQERNRREKERKREQERIIQEQLRRDEERRRLTMAPSHEHLAEEDFDSCSCVTCNTCRQSDCSCSEMSGSSRSSR